MGIKKALSTILALGAVSLAGCDESQYITGTVIKESGSILSPSRTNNPTYNLQIKTDDGSIYNFGVYAPSSGRPGQLETFTFAIDNGTKVKIRKEYIPGLRDHLGTINCENIEIIQ